MHVDNSAAIAFFIGFVSFYQAVVKYWYLAKSAAEPKAHSKKTDAYSAYSKNQIEAQRSGFDLERRSSGVSARWLLMQSIKSRRKRYEACDDVVRVTGVEPARLSAREPKSRMSANSIIPADVLLTIKT